MKLKHFFRMWLIYSVLLFASSYAIAIDQVKIIAAFPAGGGTDAIARMFADRLRATIPATTFVIENKPGANGNLGAIATARSATDGRTLLVTSDGVITVNHQLYKNVGFSPNELTPLGLMATQASVLVVPQNSPIRTVTQFIMESKKRELSYSSGGIGSAGHLTMAYLDSTAGTRHLHVPYTGGAPAILSLIGNQVDCAFVALPNALQHIQSGKLRALAVSSPERSASLPEVPTMIESGYKDFQVVTATLLMAPSMTPPDVRERWAKSLADFVQTKDFQTKLLQIGMEQKYLPAEETAEWLNSERKKWESIIVKNNINAE